MNKPKYSVIVPVYNRPNEVRDFLESMMTQTRKDFEIILVEDGSTVTCEEVVQEYAGKLPIRYYSKPNSGPGPTRNFGFAHGLGEYFVVFDSDCVLPPAYFESVDQAMKTDPLDAWGGPDVAHERFSVAQRAMAYSMSSILTTGGIRGGKKRIGWFQPRSFNMGISKKVFEVTEGFRFDRYAEDIELSIRMKKAGFRIGLISDAFVYHKRRATFFQFFKQVFNFGKGRALIGKVHPEEVKLTHWFPALFTIGTLALPLLLLARGYLFHIVLALYVIYLTAIFFHSLLVTRHLGIAFLSVVSAVLQLWGYGLGFLAEKFRQKKV
ncbi:MAG TPA: glycosyltransferase [Chryseosolibacter sp.]|nr:glycosyltransferase [Chryseosolibacter sp.]